MYFLRLRRIKVNTRDKEKSREINVSRDLILAEAVGIEPTSMVLETTVLPLNYASILALSNQRIEL